MPKSETGFAHIVLIAVVAALVVATGGYVVYEHQKSNTTPATTGSTITSTSANAGTSNSSPSLTMSSSQSNTASGVANNLNSLASSLNTGESSLNAQANTKDQASDATVGTAATNLGGAYNASNY